MDDLTMKPNFFLFDLPENSFGVLFFDKKFVKYVEEISSCIGEISVYKNCI